MIHYMTTQGLGQPWVGNELNIVQRSGIPFRLHAMRRPEQKLFESPWAAELNRRTNVLYPLPPIGLILSMLAAPFLFGGRFFAALGEALFGPRESMRARLATLAHLIVACHWARTIRHEKVSHIHSQWAHSSGSIGMYGAWLLGKSFSFTGHAADLFRNRAALKTKIRRAEFIICISSFHRDFFLKEGARPEQLEIAYCGIDTSLFSPMQRQRAAGERYRILSAGRLVGKKGFEYLIDACKVLADRGRDFECVIAGSGPLETELKQRVTDRALDDRISVTGKPLTQEGIPAFMRTGDVFVLACVWAKDDDVDGLPQLTMEGMACGIPAITTRLVGNPDLVIDGKTGLLVEPEQVEPLANAIERMMDDEPLARQYAAAGREWVCERFDITRSLEPLMRRYRAKLGMGDAPVMIDLKEPLAAGRNG
ncbi:MAG: glycosyltransferase [Planctomycetes bacterium]|nr:glycosyltransferase [Planctomycetota bacterium]